jgi:hypothetical protein
MSTKLTVRSSSDMTPEQERKFLDRQAKSRTALARAAHDEGTEIAEYEDRQFEVANPSDFWREGRRLPANIDTLDDYEELQAAAEFAGPDEEDIDVLDFIQGRTA